MAGDYSVRAFVRNAWILLGFQLVAAAVAVSITAWAALQVRPLFVERDRLTKEIADSQARVTELEAKETKAREAVSQLEKRASALSKELQGARAATPILEKAIRAYHGKNYSLAIVKYDEALRLDPGDPYIYNLKSYSQYKADDLEGAINTLSRALEMDPSYEWGYFDLARYLCKAGKYDNALDTIISALEVRGQSIRNWVKFFLAKDGDFRTACSKIGAQLQELARSP